MPIVKIKSVGESGVIIHKFMTENEARAFIMGWREAIHIPSHSFRIFLDGKEI